MRAMERMTPERLEQAQVALDEYAEIEREPSALAAAHHAFHAAILDDVTGAVDRRVLEILWHSADRYLHLLMDNLDRAPETTEARITEHRALLDLARAGKAEELRDAWVHHLDSSEAALQLALERQPDANEAARA
jgi:DNA-binding FadR family transcriptional regulator